MERERIANVLCLVHIFFLCLYSSSVTHSLNLFIFSSQFDSFAPLTVGPGETSVVPPTHQLRGLSSRLSSLGGDGENQQFSKSDRAENFHSEKTKIMKETDFSTTVYFDLSIAVSVSRRFFSVLPQSR